MPDPNVVPTDTEFAEALTRLGGLPTNGEIAAVLTAVGECARVERRQSPQYQELAACDTMSRLVDRARSLMASVVHDLSDILRERGHVVNADTYALLKVLPLASSQLRAGFQAERSMGCADRARAVLARMVTDPDAQVELLIRRPAYCNGNVTFCPEHGWGAHREELADG